MDSIKMSGIVTGIVTKAKSPPWTEEAELCLCNLVNTHQEVLFGEMRGCGVVKITQMRRNTWETIAKTISSKYTTPRSIDQCRKKFQNLKSKTLQKIQADRHPPTGGGLAVSYSAAEEFLSSTLTGRSITDGVEGGVDTDVRNPSSQKPSSCEDSQKPSPCGDSQKPSPCGDAHASSQATTDVKQDASFHRSSIQPGSSSSKRVVTVIDQDSHVNKKQKKGTTRKQDEINLLTTANFNLDNEKIKLEIILMKEKQTNLLMEREVLALKKTYLEKRIVSEFASGNKLLDDFIL